MNDFDGVTIDKSSWSYRSLIGNPRDSLPLKAPRFVTASTNVNPLDDSLLVDCTSGAVTLTLETAQGCDGRYHTFKKTDSSSNAMIIDGNGSETVEGTATVSTTVQGITFIVWSDGTNWRSVVLQPGSVSSGGGVTSVGFIDTNDATTSVSGTPVTTTGTLSLDAVDAGSDKLVFWDDSAGQKDYLALGTGLSITGTTINATATSSLTLGQMLAMHNGLQMP